MNYTSIISVTDAKTYLGVDDDSRDREIERMIGASLSFLEIATNYHFIPKDKNYQFTNGAVNVYDFPINTETPDGVEDCKLTNYTRYTSDSVEGLTLNVGYSFLSEVPIDLLEVGYAILEHLFEGGDVGDITPTITMMLYSKRRFLV